MADNTWDMIDKRIKVMNDRNKKMDDTADLLQWDDNPYQLVTPGGKALKDAISVTPNLPKVFAHGVISDLLSGKWQTVIEGKVSARQAHYAEEFIDDALAQADEFILNEHGIPSLFSWLCNHVGVRWAIGARYISQVVDGEFQIDCEPVDMRWTPFLLKKWVAPITFWAEDELKERLEKYEKQIRDAGGTFNKVTSLKAEDNEQRDYWSQDKHELLINKQSVFTEPNHIGSPPFIIVIPSAGFMLRGKGWLKHEGEDVLFLNAGLYKELARSISLEQTSGYAGLYPAYEIEQETLTADPADPAPPLDTTWKVKPGERHVPVPRGDINRAGQTARIDIQEMIDAGGPRVPKEYNQPPSAVLLAGETALIQRLQNARKQALGAFKSQLARMALKQFINAGEGEFSIGKEGKRSKYSPSRLGDPDKYNITYHLSVKSKRQELANLAEFSAAYDKLPLEWNLTNILMADDPAGIMRDLDLQRAKQLNPAISLLEMAVEYARKAADIEDEMEADLLKEQSKILTHDYVMAMKQRIAPTVAPTPQLEQPKGDRQLLSSLVAGTEGRRERQEVV